MASKDEIETSTVEVMDTDLDDGPTQLPELEALESMELELNKIQGAGGDPGTPVNSVTVLSATTQVSTQTALPTSSSVVRASGTSSSLGLIPATVQQQSGGSSVVTLQNSQVLLSSLAPSSGGTAAVHTVRRSSGSDSAPGQTVTKMIITKNTGSQQVQSTGLGAHTPTVIVTTTASGTSLLSQPKTPPKETFRVVMSSTGVFSPQKILTTPSTPTKQIIPAGKVPITPLKTPPKITMVPIAKSPQKGVPGQPQIITMVGKSLVSGPGGSATVNMGTPKAQTFQVSPSKVIIKGQHVGVAQSGAAQGSMVAQQLGAPSQIRSSSVVSSSNVQPLTVSGNKFQYVRLVSTPATQSHTTTVKATAIAPAPTASIARSATPMGPIKIMPVNQGQQQLQRPAVNPTLTSVLNQNQRVILPATSQVSIRPSIQPQASTFAQIRPGPAPGGATNTLNQLPPGTTIISSGQNMQGVQGFALVPAQYVPQLQQQFLQQQPHHKSDNYVPISSSGPVASSSHTRHNGATESGSSRPRKPCNCTKSQCLKLYCDCFANGEFCNDCNCMNCYNNLEHEEERARAIKSCLERNPQAFHPKIGKGKGKGDRDRRHNKGCNCKRSGCLKNYCECYEAKILCSTLCKCCGCKNFEESPDRKTLMHLADAAEVRVKQQTAATTKLSSQIRDLPPRVPPSTSGERPAYSFMTTEVAEATCHCLVAQAEEAERTRQIEITQERMILEEFGRCLMQVIESANKTKLGGMYAGEES